jgi:hypothetical protein
VQSSGGGGARHGLLGWQEEVGSGLESWMA